MADTPRVTVPVDEHVIKRLQEEADHPGLGDSAMVFGPDLRALLRAYRSLSAAPAGGAVKRACVVFQEAIDDFEADVADVMAEGSERADLWDREITVNIDALKTVMSAALATRHEAPAEAGVKAADLKEALAHGGRRLFADRPSLERPEMTHPLTPHKKAVAILDDHTTVGGTSASRTGQVNSEELAGLILTALATGSGDHAELVEDAMDALQIIDAFPSNQGEVEGRITEKGDRMLSSCTRDARRALETLLAENAALRAMAEKVSDGSMEQTDKLLAMHDRVTEAERKLAEAVEWRPIETAPRDAVIMLFGLLDPHPSDREAHAQLDRPKRFTGYWDEVDEAWCPVGSTWEGPWIIPTHWLPLPPAPGAEA
ncbi:MAG TPA: hypothetical protein DCF67_08925 [Brevundimonas sp.]|nr:hypothetical protein [Brevundimonas sp.]